MLFRSRVVQKALTFDDVLLIPAHSTTLPRDASLVTRLTRTINLNIPLVSAAMDTVTESRLAIAIAQEGGIGIIHKNLPTRTQAAEVAKVKRFESGVLRDPMTISPDMTVRQVIALQPGIAVKAERVHHWTSRWGADRDRALWTGFAVTLPAGGDRKSTRLNSSH